MNAAEIAGKLILRWKARPGLVKKVLRGQRFTRAAPPARDKVTAAAVQMRIFPVRIASEYVLRTYELTRQAVEHGAQLVAFPEDVASHLLGLLPGMDRLAGAGSLDQALASLGSGVKLADVFRFAGPAVSRLYRETFSYLARGFGVHLVAGSACLPGPDGRVYNLAHLFGPDGTLLGVQAKTHLLPAEAGWGICPGEDLLVWDLSFARLAAPVCMDATYFESFRILSGLGAEVIVLPIANPEEYHFHRAQRGLAPRVQENRVYGVQSALVGEAFGLRLEGKSGIYAPLALSPEGVLAEVSDPTAEGVAAAELDLETLRELRRQPWGLRPDVYRKYLPNLYPGEGP